MKGQWLHRLADYLEGSGWLRVLSALSHIGIVVAVIVFILDWPVRQETLKAFKEEREARAWSLIYQASGRMGDGGRRYALQYLNNEKKANLAGLPLAKAYLVNVKLLEAYLVAANLREANLSRADLIGANLSEANLTTANLYTANLSEAYLSEANLSRADLLRANLRGANLSKANLSEANLTTTNLLWAKNLTQKQIDDAFYCEGREPPKLPVEFNPPPTRKCDKAGKPIGGFLQEPWKSYIPEITLPK